MPRDQCLEPTRCSGSRTATPWTRWPPACSARRAPSAAGAPRAACGWATPRAAHHGARHQRAPAPCGERGRPTAIWQPCARVARALVASLPPRCPAHPGLPAPWGPGCGASGHRVATTACCTGTPCAPWRQAHGGAHGAWQAAGVRGSGGWRRRSGRPPTLRPLRRSAGAAGTHPHDRAAGQARSRCGAQRMGSQTRLHPA